MKELIFDSRCLGSGIGTYATNLISGMKLHEQEFALKAIVRYEDRAKLTPLLGSNITLLNAPIYSLREQIQVPWVARKADLLHALHYNAPLLFRGILLASILDLTHILDKTYSKTIKSKMYARPMLHAVSQRADHIFTLSEYSKRQIMEHLNVPESKVTVCYCGVGAQFSGINRAEAQARVGERLNVRRPFILFVGNLKPHKNVKTLLRAFSILRDRYKLDHDLLIIGNDRRWKSSLLEESATLHLNGSARFVNYVEQDLLPLVYAAAELLVLPSFEEGFGLPVLEAMSAGTAVVCSRAASLPEVGGDAAVYFEAASPEELAARTFEVLSSGSLRERMRTRGVNRAARFTWEQCVQKHYDIYRQFCVL